MCRSFLTRRLHQDPPCQLRLRRAVATFPAPNSTPSARSVERLCRSAASPPHERLLRCYIQCPGGGSSAATAGWTAASTQKQLARSILGVRFPLTNVRPLKARPLPASQFQVAIVRPTMCRSAATTPLERHPHLTSMLRRRGRPLQRPVGRRPAHRSSSPARFFGVRFPLTNVRSAKACPQPASQSQVAIVRPTPCRSAASPPHERFVDVTPISLRRDRPLQRLVSQHLHWTPLQIPSRHATIPRSAPWPRLSTTEWSRFPRRAPMPRCRYGDLVAGLPG